MNWFQRLFHSAIPQNESPYPKMGQVTMISVEEKVIAKTFYSAPNSQKRLTQEAISEAKELELPDFNKRMQRPAGLDWIKAFDWYNKHIHIGQYPLSMGCVPCWNKVYASLKSAKDLSTPSKG